MLQLGRFRGVPVVIAPSWLIIGVLLTAVYGPIVDDAVTGIGAGTAYLAAFGFSVLFGLCVLAHELGHTIVSMVLGHPVRRVVLFLLGGVSEIEGEPERARDELLIASAGPLVSGLIAAGAWFGYHALPSGSLGGVVLALLSWSNIILTVFNLLPGLPLDGGRLLRAVVWALGGTPLRGTKVAAWTGRVVAVLVAASGFVVRGSTWDVVAAAMTAVLGLYLWTAATQALRLADLMARLPDVTVSALLRPGLMLPSDVSVAEALRRTWEGNARGVVLLDRDDRPSAIVDESLIGAVPMDRRPWTQASEVARPLEPGLILPLGLHGKALLSRMRETPAHEYLVVAEDGSPAGILATADFARRLQGQP